MEMLATCDKNFMFGLEMLVGCYLDEVLIKNAIVFSIKF